MWEFTSHTQSAAGRNVSCILLLLPSTELTVTSLSSGLRRKTTKSTRCPCQPCLPQFCPWCPPPRPMNLLAQCRNYCAKFPYISFATVQRSGSNSPFWPLCLYFSEHLPLQSYANRSNRKRVGNQESLHPVPFTDHQVSPFSMSIIYHIQPNFQNRKLKSYRSLLPVYLSFQLFPVLYAQACQVIPGEPKPSEAKTLVSEI